MNTINSLCVREIEFRLIESGIHRVLICLDKLNDEQIQYRPNANSNSINNQILHLNGNVRQWLISIFHETIDMRKRDEEFDNTNQKSKKELKKILLDLENDIRSTFPIILEADLYEEKEVQCYTESLFSIIVHVIEHFSYHLGQITYITKMLLDIDTNYYGGDDLNSVNT